MNYYNISQDICRKLIIKSDLKKYNAHIFGGLLHSDFPNPFIWFPTNQTRISGYLCII